MSWVVSDSLLFLSIFIVFPFVFSSFVSLTSVLTLPCLISRRVSLPCSYFSHHFIMLFMLFHTFSSSSPYLLRFCFPSPSISPEASFILSTPSLHLFSSAYSAFLSSFIFPTPCSLPPILFLCSVNCHLCLAFRCSLVLQLVLPFLFHVSPFVSFRNLSFSLAFPLPKE